MRVILFCLFSFAGFVAFGAGVSADTAAPAGVTAATDTTDYVAILKKTPPYDSNQRQSFPAFTYQSATNPDLRRLRLTYHLDSVAGTGSDISRAIRLLEWFHNRVPHADVAPLPVLTAENIITTYAVRHYSQGCYPLAIAMNEIFLSMGFPSRFVICFSGKYPVPDGGHVINSVYIASLHKWVYMDPQDNAYVQDEQGHFLSIQEVRERLIDGRPLVLNATANYHHQPDTKQDYLYTFIARNIYRMICPLNSEFNSETRSKGAVLHYVELLPVGSVDPLVDGYETSQRKGYRVITYHTNNARVFWQGPGGR